MEVVRTHDAAQCRIAKGAPILRFYGARVQRVKESTTSVGRAKTCLYDLVRQLDAVEVRQHNDFLGTNLVSVVEELENRNGFRSLALLC
jgi:hypothetical protein